MSNLKKYLGMLASDNYYFRFIIVIMLFLLLAFDRDLSLIYIFILFGDWIWFQSDNFLSFPGQRRGSNTMTVLVESAAALGIFLALSNFLVRAVSPQTLGSGIVEGTQSIFQLLATGTPILQGSKILTLIGWGVLVPIIETKFFFGRLLEGFATYSERIFGQKVSLQKLTVLLIIIITVIASIFTLFHITAKGLSSIPLLITFIFAIVSCLLVIRHQETRGAIWIHIATNSLAVAASFAWI